jgi:NADH-quinone oxidoreductase subunit F
VSDPALHQEAVDRIVSQTGRAPGDLIPILRAIQDEFHYLPEDALRRVCETTEITPRALAGVSSFYAQFRHRPAGRYRLRVCEGTACHVRGASDIEQAFRHELRIPADDDTDPDRVFTVEKVACLGCCMLAPVAQVQDVTYGTLAPRGIPEVLRDFLAAQNGSTAARSRRRRSRTGTYAAEVRTCLCSSCRAAGADGVIEELHRQIDANRLPARVRDVGCTGISYQAPLLEVIVNGGSFRYGAVHPEHVGSILRRHIQPEGRLRQAGQALLNRMEELVEQGPAPDGVVRYAQEIRDETTLRYTGAQCRIATEHAGEVSPLDLDGYLAREGFEALRRCVEEWSPEEIIAQIEASGLRGRGGAGFPTGLKWARVREAAGDRKVVICNGDEGDPGAFMDRMILESFPFRVLEGMAIAAVAVGAEEGIFYVRAEYPLATRRVREAIRLAEEKGFLGDDVLGRKRRLHFRVVEGAGAFVCGEETALLAAVEGRRGMPRIRPPYPAQSGLYGRPTLINNVETLSTLSWILRHGPEAFRGARHQTKHRNQGLCIGRQDRARRIDRGADGDDPAADCRGGGRRGAGRQGGESRAGRRPVGGMRPGFFAGHAGGLPGPGGGGGHHGVGRHGRHGRERLHGRRGSVLSVVHAAGVVRQVYALPGRHAADAGDPRRPVRGAGHRGGFDAIGVAVPDRARRQPVRAGGRPLPTP